MRRAPLLLALAACSAPAPLAGPKAVAPGAKSIVIEPPASAAASAPGGPSAPAPRIAPAAPSHVASAGPATFETKAGDVAWVSRLPRSPRFRKLALPREAAGAPLRITWLAHPQRRLKGAPPDAELPFYFAGRFELVLAQGAAEARVDLGTHPGHPSSLELTHCERRGYRPADGQGWSFPSLPNLASAFSAGIIQGSTDYLLVAGEGALHLLHRKTHDGACPARVKQGPLETCADMKYVRLAELGFSGEPRGEESIELVDEAGGRAPLDCNEGRFGENLVAP